MRILGISAFGRQSAVALLDGTTIRFAIEEEKLNRSPDAAGLPRLALERCLHEAQLQLSDLRSIGVADRGELLAPAGSRRNNKKTTTATAALRQWLHGAPRPSNFDHHLSHAASAYYTSGLDAALVLSLDQGFRSQSGLVALAQEDDIRPLHAFKFPDSLGWFYSSMTALAGLRPVRDDHKLQWLSKDGSPEFLPILRRVFVWKPSGAFALDRRYLRSGPDGHAAFSPKLYRELGLSYRNPSVTPGQRANLARSAQALLEEVVLQLAENFQQRTGARNLCLAGGVFLNVMLVHALETRGPFDNVYVQPVAGNAGTALGAAYLSRKKLTGDSGRAPLPSLALGVRTDSQEVKAVLDNCKIAYRYLTGDEQLVDEAVPLLHRGKIVAWCQGRSEFGHRALGHRSLLASPFSEYVVENVNQFVKHREEFHPFALSVPAERDAEYFSASPNCRAMASLGRLLRPVAGLERFAFLGDVVRVHLVDQNENPLFWTLLHKFGESAPAPILVNTSFNLFGEPLVTDPRSAVRSFYCSGVDALALGPFLLVK